MKFVPVKAGVLLALNLAALNPKENTLDEVILKNYEAHKDGSPETVLNVSEAVANRILELGPAPVVSTETDVAGKLRVPSADLLPAVVLQPVVETVASVPTVPVVAPVVPVVETVASVAATNPGPIVEPGPTVPDSQTASSSEVLDPPAGDAKTEEKTKAKR